MGAAATNGRRPEPRSRVEPAQQTRLWQPGAPRERAARLVRSEHVSALEFVPEGLQIATLHGTGALGELTRIGAEEGGFLDAIHPLDDSLEAVFGYLVAT